MQYSKMSYIRAEDFLSGNITVTAVEKLKKKELILVAKELDAELQVEGKAQLSEQDSKIFKKDQITRSMSLVPMFDEKEVEKYFLIFEKVAKSMDWPTDMFCLFLQSVLTGNARDVYCAFSSAQCSYYRLVNERILQGYELAPEVYH